MPTIEVEEELKDILPGFLKNREKDIASLKEAISNNDLKAMEKIGHKVSGSSGGYGFTELGNIAKQLELSAKAGNMEEAVELVNQFESYMQDIDIVFV